MASFTDVVGTFETGDIVFVYYPPKGVQPIHVTIFLAAADAPPALGGAGFVHAGPAEVEVAPVAAYEQYRDGGGYMHSTHVNSARRGRLAGIAKTFAATARRTPYGSYPGSKDFQSLGPVPESPHANRFTGMMHTQNVGQLPFDATALLRLMKWTLRASKGETLSEKRGITCAAFATLCGQVGEMLDYLRTMGVENKLENCVNKMNNLFETKAELRERKNLETLIPSEKSQTGKPIYRDQAYRGNSNREMKVAITNKLNQTNIDVQELESFNNSIQAGVVPLSGVDKFWILAQKNFLGLYPSVMQSVSDIIPPEFLLDAKYMNSRILVDHINGAGGWRQTVHKTY